MKLLHLFRSTFADQWFICRPIEASSRLFGALQTHSSLRLLLQKPVPRHPEVSQRKQRVQLRGVLGQTVVARLHVPELALDHPKRVFQLGSDAGLYMFEFFRDFAHRRGFVQCSAFARVNL